MLGQCWTWCLACKHTPARAAATQAVRHAPGPHLGVVLAQQQVA